MKNDEAYLKEIYSRFEHEKSERARRRGTMNRLIPALCACAAAAIIIPAVLGGVSTDSADTIGGETTFSEFYPETGIYEEYESVKIEPKYISARVAPVHEVASMLDAGGAQAMYICSREELDNFIKENDNTLELSKRRSSPSFAEMVSDYDEAFFEKSRLELIYIYESDPMIRHVVDSISQRGESDGSLLEINISEYTSDFVQSGETGWILALSIPRALPISWKANVNIIGAGHDCDLMCSPKFSAHFTWVGWTDEDGGLADTPRFITTAEELQEFIDEYAACLGLDYHFNGGMSFSDLATGFDKGFFRENQLLIAYLIEPSGSIRHTLTSAKWYADSGNESSDGGKIIIGISRHIPESYTDDMAGWLMTLTLPREIGQAENILIEGEDCIHEGK